MNIARRSIVAAAGPMKPLTSGPYHHFFGYFDKSPWAADASRSLIASHRTMIYDRMPEPGEAVELGIVDVDHGGGFEKLADSRAWNLQQGAMLQWLPAPTETILYNDIVDGQACAIRLEIGTGKRHQYSRPVAAVSPDGNHAISINFGRLTSMAPDYGYSGLADPFASERLAEQDGLWSLDLQTGQSQLMMSTAQIAAFGPDGDSPGATHYINHPLYNRTGDRFCFLHRYISPAGTRNTRMLSCKSDGSDLRLLVSGMASHFGWRNSSELLAWAGERAMLRSANSSVGKRLPVGKILKSLYRMLGKPAAFKSAVMKDRYIVFDHDHGTSRTIARGTLVTDGHCSFSADERWFVTDCYPDKRGITKLYLCEWDSESVYCVQEFRQPVELDDEIRCDLHPRWHPSKPLICVDSAHTGQRQMYQLDVSGIANGCLPQVDRG